MKIRKPPEKDESLEKAIEQIYMEMASYDAESKEYAKCVKQLSTLYSLRPKKEALRVSPDTLVIVAGNLIGIGIIVAYESRNVVTSKALNFVMKLR